MYKMDQLQLACTTVASSVCRMQLVFGCVAILLLSFTVRCQVEKPGDCNYLYKRQPGKANCNPEDPLPLELRCQVTGNDNFTIRWHYSNNPPSQDNSSSVNTVLESNEMLNVKAQELQPLNLVSVLTVNFTDFEMAAGYYWCTVKTDESTPNPSQVLHISICPINGNAMMTNCMTNISLFEDTTRCANHDGNIDIENVQLGCTDKTHRSTTDSYAIIEESTTTDQLTVSPSSGFPMHFIWMIVGIAFALLIAIIIVMLIAIVYLNHKKNKIRVSSTSRNHIHNSYVEETLVFSTGAITTGQQEIRAEAGYEIPTNVIHARNATFGGDHSPDSKTSSSRSALHSPPGEYEEVGTVKTTRDSIKAAQRHQYEMVESGEQSEYSHLQHAHGGSRKFSTNSTGTAPLPSTLHSRGKVSITSSLSLSGHQPEPIFDSPEYMTIELEGSKSTKTRPETGEGVINADTGYSHIKHEELKGMDTTGETEGPDLDSEGYHQLPSVFSGAAKQQLDGEISPEQRQNSHITNTHPPAHRHKSATLASEPYTPTESANVMKRNAYSFSIVSTDEQYVNEHGHIYHLLERSDEHQQNRSIPGSNEGSLKFHIQEDDSVKDRKESNSIPPYSQVNKSSNQDSSKQKEIENNEEQSDSISLQGSSTESSRKVIPPYSQVDKSKKKNRQPQAQLDTQLNQETHHYHVLEQNSEDKIEASSGEKGGPIYHIIDHEP